MHHYKWILLWVSKLPNTYICYKMDESWTEADTWYIIPLTSPVLFWMWAYSSLVWNLHSLLNQALLLDSNSFPICQYYKCGYIDHLGDERFTASLSYVLEQMLGSGTVCLKVFVHIKLSVIATKWSLTKCATSALPPVEPPVSMFSKIALLSNTSLPSSHRIFPLTITMGGSSIY